MVDTYRACAEDHGVDFIGPPETTQDSTGMLREEFWHLRDATHANDTYGRLYLQRVWDWAIAEGQ